ncbi:helix-turn-helix domain-containing protein [Arthrobacter sp.]|uniref:helix-turn-helix domain-containing protein n=1 Tax=Arthrobacter sp. TaxID=1667 RepID=UPI003393BB57
MMLGLDPDRKQRRTASHHGRASFDSRPVPAVMQKPLWEAATAKLLVPLEIDSQVPTVAGVIRGHQIGAARICQLAATPHAGRRTRRLAAGVGSGYYKVALARGGTISIEQHGRRVLLQPGELAIYDTSDEYVVGSDLPFGLMIVLVPHDALELSRDRVAAVAASRLSPELAENVRKHLLALEPDGSAVDVDRAMDSIRTAVVSHPRIRAQEPLSSPLLAARVRELVGQKLTDPGLSPDYLAAVLGVSRRYLYAACGTELGPLATYIRIRRLERSRQLLVSPAGEISIAGIAWECGFPDPAHFSRLFRNMYGLSPTQFLRAGGGE